MSDERKPDPVLDRTTPPGAVPLESPMPRSPVLDKEEPELSTEEDIGSKPQKEELDTPPKSGTHTTSRRI